MHHNIPNMQSDLYVILHGGVHHHQVGQEGAQVRNGPLHHALFTEEIGLGKYLFSLHIST